MSESLNIEEMFHVLQQEYVVCVIRAKIYPRGKHTKYWSKISNIKKERILDIAKKNQLPSIFDDSRIMDSYKSKVLDSDVAINFYYNPTMEDDQEYWDLFNYYLKDSPVVVKDEYHGRIVNTDIKDKNCLVEYINNEGQPISELFHFDELKRKDI